MPFGIAALAALLIALPLPGSTARSAPEPAMTTALPTEVFLESIGVVSTFPDRGQPIEETIRMVRFGGFRWVRAGIEGLSENGPTTLATLLRLHRETGVKFSWGLVSGGNDLPRLLRTGRELAGSDALLAFEGLNEPNNWPVTYQGETGGGQDRSWLPVAKLQRDLYTAVKADPLLARYPVWTVSEPGAQTDNVGLQFLEIPPWASTPMPAGTRYADFANVHNYIYHPHSPEPADNKVWNAAAPGPEARVDGLYGNYGRTWRNWFTGYTQARLDALPRVTTETGAAITGTITEEVHGRSLLTLYLAQFRRGYSYTSVYLLRDRTDEAGNQAFGFFRRDYSPRPAALYLHNLTTILADRGRIGRPGRLDYAIANRPETVHELLLQRRDGAFQLVIWGERVRGADHIAITFGQERPAVTIYDPTVGARPLRSLTKVRRVDLTLANHPYVIEIAPRAR
ncbi:glycosyl hydrolase [Novosphingobium flavum]|uniref:Glycosyl hydrolase n=1 Tax=Novosphingobium flavum TaxID=1778672 RepID=A0A7X1KLE2_9SPHN|nr:glycosyl hydrolase [Novosphingobium flavum]MBC2665145.1 glycosyl hydrolase [Novosphingobium flavum]